jgi:mono/diheme cytochrome c family protein
MRANRHSMARVAAMALAGLLLAGAAAYFARETSAPAPPGPAPELDSAVLAKGQYLVRAGNCLSCHTAPDGKPYAGGRAIPTPFGTIYSSNITPDPETGIGKWSPGDFWRAIHEGISRDGSFLYPAFPFTNYTKVRREDSDAMFAYLRTLEPAAHAVKPPEMRFPYGERALLAGWRALYFEEGTYADDPKQTPQWNRGAYLVQGLGHCSACHSARNAWGAVNGDRVEGGVIPVLDWYAPSLTSSRETGLGDWDVQHVVELLKTGISPRGAVFGPMSEVVRDSLQHLTPDDLTAMVVYLKSQREEGPRGDSPGVQITKRRGEELMAQGERVYQERCVDCHGANGLGVTRVYPPLANNEAILMRNPLNAIRVTLNGGFPPSTQGNLRPYGMPPFAHVLSDLEVAAVVTYIRGAWGNHSPPVSPVEVARARGVPLE